MTENHFSIDDVKIGNKDLTESEILKIYTKVSPKYAVYRTRDRVSVQFSDDDILASSQRKTMATLNLLRTQINALIDGWSRSSWESFRAKAAKFDGRVATALILCLEDDVASAATSLNATKDEIVAERSSWGRFEYLIAASIVSAIAVAAFTIVQNCLYRFDSPSDNIWLAARAGTIGAFFSIALAIHGRTVLTNLNRRDNFADATLRIVIGVIAAGVFVLILGSKIVTGFKLGGAEISGPDMTWQIVSVVGFLAGFVERLIPDLLKKATDQDATEAASAPNKG